MPPRHRGSPQEAFPHSFLVTLYALDPEPSTPTGLALQPHVIRTTITDTIDAPHASN